MKIPFFKAREERGRFQPAELEERAEPFSNPARGWYQIHTFLIEEEPDLEEQRWCLRAEDTLALVLINIGSYKAKDLDETALGRIRRILEFFARWRRDCIVRVVYDHQGRAPEREPFFFGQVLTHLRQVMEVLRPFSAFVLVFQGMLVGNWGEMHNSRFLTRDRLPQMAEVLRTNRGEDTWLAVRRPSQWRLLHRDQAGGDPVCFDGMGLFDDGIFGSWDHLGTFGSKDRGSVPWDSPWRREDELAFEHALSRQAPLGGEAVYGGGYIQELAPADVIAALRAMGVTYLNRDHDMRLLRLWGEQRCQVRGVWSDRSLLEYVGAHLGYRLLVRSVRAEDTRRDGLWKVEMEAENTGFAPVYQEGSLVLEFADRLGMRRAEVLEGGMQGWQSGEVRRWSAQVPLGNGPVLLRAERRRDGAQILFGNRCGEDGKVLLGRVMKPAKE